MICTALVIAATMYKIAISIQMLLIEITEAERLKRKNRFYIWLLIILVCGVSSFITVYSVEDFDISTMQLLNLTIFASLSVLFTLVIVFLLSKLDKMQQGGLNSERRKILRQYIVFVVAFMYSTFYYTTTYIFFDVNSDSIILWFWNKVTECSMIIISTIMPIAYVLWVHSHTYNKMIMQA